jgi:S-(hydroxymethyl)glutathione dehydrogenase/alcohol dehydrogenase
MKDIVLREVGRPTAVEELALRSLGDHEVRVRLRASGVCHSDLSLRDGSIPTLLPSTLGHEGAGIVAEVGAAVGTVSPGDHVVLTWNVPCRSCPHCLRGEAQLCVHGYDHAYGAPYAEGAGGPVWPGMGVGSLAEETLLPAAAVVPVDASLPFDLAALLGCGVTTGVGAAMRTAAVRPGESVLVIGCGGVGLAAIQGARLAGAAGIEEEEVTFRALSLMADGKTVQGSVYGASDPARDIPVLAELAQRGRLDLEALVTRRIGIDDVETAFADMAAGRGARSVVCFA